MRIKHLFFDRQTVVRAVDKAKRAVLSQSARAIRDEARNSMPRREGLAPPGQPPYMRSAWLKRSVLWGWDRATKSALVGPVRMAGAGAASERMLMRVLEFGGRYELGKKARRRRKIRADRKIVVHVSAKPYMGPALEKERPHIPKR